MHDRRHFRETRRDVQVSDQLRIVATIDAFGVRLCPAVSPSEPTAPNRIRRNSATALGDNYHATGGDKNQRARVPSICGERTPLAYRLEEVESTCI